VRGSFLLFADESPNLVHFDIAAVQSAHLLVKNPDAHFADTKTETHNGVAVDASNALNAADARALAKHGNYRRLLFEL